MPRQPASRGPHHTHLASRPTNTRSPCPDGLVAIARGPTPPTTRIESSPGTRFFSAHRPCSAPGRIYGKNVLLPSPCPHVPSNILKRVSGPLSANPTSFTFPG